MPELVILYADADLLVCDKPAGLLAVPGRGPDKQDCLSARVQARYPDALVVHRLDMATSGIMLFGRGAAAQRALSMAFAARRVHKRYVAVVAGRLAAPATDWGVIDLPLAPDWPNRPRSRVDPVRGKPSLTRWRVLGREAGTTRVELEPVTGRSHQLRVHLAALGHAILGDPLYGPQPEGDRGGRLLLHASRLRLRHPGDGRELDFASRVPF
ncbi:RluA family pseudouridine synthase [Parasulfuritortus cantonensis]|uniref:RluA family pseudouridine synthase n=2 Tax=Parasulfuritortus cantonensis TaxID=2528202 RepID=A0A4R1BN67_9PROT|nr:RluA family pseudouridine synthase [Parasulfuritortus cantonensis]